MIQCDLSADRWVYVPACAAWAFIEDLKGESFPVFNMLCDMLWFNNTEIEHQKVPTKSINTAEREEGDPAGATTTDFGGSCVLQDHNGLWLHLKRRKAKVVVNEEIAERQKLREAASWEKRGKRTQG